VLRYDSFGRPWRRGVEANRASSLSSQGRQRWCVLQVGVNDHMASFATMICGRCGGPSRCRVGISSTSKSEAFSRASRWSSVSSHHQVVRPRLCHVGHRRRLVPGGEDQGLNHVFLFCFRVLSAKKNQDYVVFLFFHMGPACILYPPTVY
jgi:hypothetical protein